MIHCWAFNIATESEGDNWAMMHTNYHRYFKACHPIGICSPSSHSVVSRARPRTSYTSFNASQFDNSRACRCSTCCREYSSTYNHNASNLKNKIGPFINRCNTKQTRTSHIKQIPYYCNCSAPLNHVAKAWPSCGHRELQFQHTTGWLCSVTLLHWLDSTRVVLLKPIHLLLLY